MRKTTTFVLTVAVLLSLSCATTVTARAQDPWPKADAAVVRLPPTVFRELPRRVVRKLVVWGCTIPQANDISHRNNVIKGNFKRANQTDWAVLCSRARASSIIIFWGGSANSFSKIAKVSDRVFVQTIDTEGTFGFFRIIAPANKAYILQHYRDYHGPKPPRLNHQGIEDGFLEKGSTIYYHSGRQWVALQGAD
jgi:hypothetical protein